MISHPQTTFAQDNLAFESAYQRGDADAVAALLTPDVIISAAEFPDLTTRETVRAALAQFFVGNEVVAYRLNPAETEVHGDSAYERGTFVWSSRAKGQVLKAEHGRYSLVRRRDTGGTWRIHRFLENRLSEQA